MKTRVLLLCLICLSYMATLFNGCCPEQDSRLVRAERIMAQYPDSALIVLDSINYAEFTRESDKAMYGMLMTQVMDKNHLNPTNDTIISYSAYYYKKVGDKLRLIISLYYQGRVFYLKEDNPRALVCYFQAKELAEEIGENFWAGMAYRGLSDIYNGTYNSKEELAYAKKSYEFFNKSGRQPYLNYALLDLGKALNNNRCEDEAIDITDQLLDSANLYCDDYLLYETRKLRLLSMLSKERIRDGIQLSYPVIESEFAGSSDSIYHALLLMKMGRLDDAIEIMDMVSDKGSPIYKIVQSSISGKSGNYEKAYHEALSLDSMVNYELKSSLSHNLTDSLVEYFGKVEQMDKAEIENSRIRFWFIAICGSLVIIILILVGYQMRSRHRKNVHDKIIMAVQLQESLDKSDLKNQKAISIIRNLTSSQYRMFEELSRLVETSEASRMDKSKISKAVSNIIAKISIDNEKVIKLEKETDIIYDNLISDFKNDIPGMKDIDYRLFLFSVYGLSNASIALLLNEEKIDAVYNRKRRLKDRIKKLDSDKSARYTQFFRTNETG